MKTKELEKQIVKAIREDSKLPLATDVGHKVLIKLVKKLFNEYRGELEYTTSTIIGMTKELERLVILNIAKVLSVIYIKLKTELRELNQIRLIKLEEDHLFIMAMETFVQ